MTVFGVMLIHALIVRIFSPYFERNRREIAASPTKWSNYNESNYRASR
jgi:hypothetical protein